ncbi:MAG: ATP-dependent sacrificial sulfur transferase LarE [Lachnospiraceae bacterium]|jgi:uncharacterized protein
MENKKKQLDRLLAAYTKEDVCLAFSGGIDSSLLLKLMVKKAEVSHKKVYAVTFDTTLHPRCDTEIAEKVAEEIGASHHILKINELDNPQILQNPVNRCYLCKRELFRKLLDFAREMDAPVILEGTNADDLQVYRPGLAAIQELGIKSPLVEAGFTKKEVREYAKEVGISVAERPSTPCLATRLPYGTDITLSVLQQIEEGEAWLRSRGYKNVRIRVHGEIARLELDAEAFSSCLKERDEIVRKLKEIGFTYITLDLEGFRSGSMDIRIKQ